MSLALLASYGCSAKDAHAAPSAPHVPASVEAPAPVPHTPATLKKDEAVLPPSAADAGARSVPSSAEPSPATHATVLTANEVLALDGSVSTSIGAPGDGQLRGAVRFPDSGPGFYHNSVRPDEARYGTVELVQTIVRAAEITEHETPGSVLVVNDLGLIEGGPIHQHGSHQAGRDADILYFSLDAKGVPLPSVGVPIDPQGKGVDFKDLADPKDDQPVQLDVKRTWRFAQALLETARDNLQRIFMVEHVRTMLLAEAARAHAPAALIQRFADITCQPDSPHDDHMHVRLYCTPEDMAAGCLDTPPTYPFRLAALSPLGLKPQLADMQRTAAQRRARGKLTTTPEQARKRAGPMHAAVIKFLDQRKAWIKQPHPGRPYCK